MQKKEKPEGQAEKKKRTPLLIENVYEKETTESFIERHFRDRAVHRCRAVAEFDMDAIVDQYGSEMVRSAQELLANPDGKGLVPKWTMVVIKRSAHVLWYFLIKSSGGYGQEPDRQFSLSVMADTAQKAAEDALMLQKHFVANSDDVPGFFLVRDIRKPKRIPLKPEYALSDEMLDLHYGRGFAEWSNRFANALGQSGLSILRGKPGTGKTSYLRHLIYTHAETHRFYYLPVDAFGLLQTQITDFLTRERKRSSNSVLVLVLEDAEALLLNRREFRDGLASSLLNFTDGFIGDMVQAHLICTINSEVKDLDEAVLRPGRQRFFREFELLDSEQAAALAAKLGIELSENRSYSLAELYHFKDVKNQDRLEGPKERTIGFAVM